MVPNNNEVETYTVRKNIDSLVNGEDKECPFPIEIIPNFMGINLCSVHDIEWTKQKKDGQLVTLTINFKPENNE